MVDDGGAQPRHQVPLVRAPLQGESRLAQTPVPRSPGARGLAESANGRITDESRRPVSRLLLQEGARARRARLVHGEVHHHAVLEADELGVLPADLKDGVGHPTVEQRVAHEGGTGLVGGDLVRDYVGADQFAHQFATGAGGSHAQDVEPRSHLLPDIGEPLAHHFHRAPICLGIDLLDEVAPGVQHDQIGGDRADIHAQIGVHPATTLRGRGPLIGVDAVAQQDHVVHGKRLSGGGHHHGYAGG